MTIDKNKPYTENEGGVLFYIDEKKRVIKGVNFKTGKTAISKCKKYDSQCFSVDFGKKIVKLRLEGKETEAEKFIDDLYEDYNNTGTMNIEIKLSSEVKSIKRKGVFEKTDKNSIKGNSSRYSIETILDKNRCLTVSVTDIEEKIKVFSIETVTKEILNNKLLFNITIEKLVALCFEKLYREYGKLMAEDFRLYAQKTRGGYTVKRIVRQVN